MTSTLRLRVVPNAKRNEVVAAYGDALKVKIQAPAMDGKANQALLEFVAEILGVPVRQIDLVAGERSRDKIFAIDGMGEAAIRQKLLAG